MNPKWQFCRTTLPQHPNRWGHSSCVLPQNDFVIFGGYAQSTFFSDVWVYNLSQNSWYEVKFSETNSKPSERSNSSFIYSELRKQIIMYGGGSKQNARNSDTWQLRISKNNVLNEYNGIWSELFTGSQDIPWGRTYHVSESFENFLVIHGGESYVGEIQDIWALNLQNLRWIQLKTRTKHRSRKFHSSSIVKNMLYIFGGICGNYDAINKVEFIDLSILKSHNMDEINEHEFQWKQVQIKHEESSIIARWGHVSKSFNDKIFIFGGRSIIDHNDLLVFDPKESSLSRINTDKPPSGRRKPCIWLMGSYLIINSGYNGKYLCDQFRINLRFAHLSSLRQSEQNGQLAHKKQTCDIHINTSDNKYIDLHSKLIRNTFESQEDMLSFLQELAEMKYVRASQFANILNKGVYVGQNQLILDDNLRSDLPKQRSFQSADEKLLKKYKITYSSSQLLSNKKKILFNLVKQNLVMSLNPLKLIRVTSTQFSRIVGEIENDFCCDLKIVCKNAASQTSQSSEASFKCCKYPLAARSLYFRNVIEEIERGFVDSQNKGRYLTQMEMNISGTVMLKIIVIYCYFGHVIIPRQFTILQCLDLFEIANHYSIPDVTNILFQEIKDYFQSDLMKLFIEQQINEIYCGNNVGSHKNALTNKQNVLTSQEDLTNQTIQAMLNFCFKQCRSYYFTSVDKTSNQKNNTCRWIELIQYLVNMVTEASFRTIIKIDELNLESLNKSKKAIYDAKPVKKMRNQEKQNIIQANSNLRLHLPVQKPGLSAQRLNKKQIQRQKNILSLKIIESKGSSCYQKSSQATQFSYFKIIQSLVRIRIILFMIKQRQSPTACLTWGKMAKQARLYSQFSNLQPQKKRSFNILQKIIEKQRELSAFTSNIYISQLKTL